MKQVTSLGIALLPMVALLTLPERPATVAVRLVISLAIVLRPRSMAIRRRLLLPLPLRLLLLLLPLFSPLLQPLLLRRGL